MSAKEWVSCSGGGPIEEWSVHAQLSFSPQAGNIVLTTREGGGGVDGPGRTDSGYGSERVMSPRSGFSGARATCTVTVGGHHTVTLTCTENPVDVDFGLASPPIHQQQQQPPCPKSPPAPTGPPHHVHHQHFCHRPPPDKLTQSAPCRQPVIPTVRDAEVQTSTSHVPLLIQDQLAKSKNRPVVRPTPQRSRGSPASYKPYGGGGTGSSSDGKKTPRTVHIDVYCTGSDSDSSSSSTEETATSTPQTVFESNKVKVLHSRANIDTLPHALQRQKRRVLSNSKLDILPLSNDSTCSSNYPSARSSFVSAPDTLSITSGSILSSRLSSVNNSSHATTSWKDTDLESIRKSDGSVFQSDSFEYENSFDKLRIREKEKLWAGNQQDFDKRPKRYTKRLSPMNQSNESSESSDEEGLAWSFGRYDELDKRNGVKREGTVKRANASQSSETSSSATAVKPTTTVALIKKSGSLSDSEAPSIKYKKSPTRTSFLTPRFEHLAKAEKFGGVLGSLRKPGHHVGPSKNPDCSCDTCRYFFEHVCYRNRTRSLGDKPYVNIV